MVREIWTLCEINMNTGLQDKSVLVTEAGNSLGRSLALAFAREGANLVLGSLKNTDALYETEREISGLGVKVVSGAFTLESEDAVKSFVRQGLDKYGTIDVLLNNVSTTGPVQSFEQMSFDAWREAIELQLTGSLFLCRAVLPGMIERRWGRVIHCVGSEGLLGGSPARSAVQMGLVGLSRGTTTQYGKYNITANCVSSAGVEVSECADSYASAKGNDPLGRNGKLREIASTAVYLASEDAGYITGQCYLVNGGKVFS
jgi:NAD(P)-dependent dehydrogenase (short-subunit alcohol dehydrogenase family)